MENARKTVSESYITLLSSGKLIQYIFLYNHVPECDTLDIHLNFFDAFLKVIVIMFCVSDNGYCPCVNRCYLLFSLFGVWSDSVYIIIVIQQVLTPSHQLISGFHFYLLLSGNIIYNRRQEKM